MKILITLVIVTAILVSLLASDQYYLSLQDKELKKSDWVQNCIPVGSDGIVPAIGLFNHTHSFDLQTCSWKPTEHGTPGFLESLYISFIEPIFLDIADSLEMKYAYASCAATILPQPCFDSYMKSHDRITEKSVMESFARNIEVNYDDWQMSDRNWADFDETLRLPAIICTEFVTDGITQYRMAKWVDAYTISSFEDHRNDWLCDKWLAPIDDGIKIKWDKLSYLPDGIGTIQVIDKDMNLDNKNIDSFDIHVWSDIDHNGIQLRMTETDEDSGTFKGTVFFTTTDESSGARLLVEDGVHAEHKENYNFSRIINEAIPEYTAEEIDTGSPNDEFTDEDLCGRGTILVDGKCAPDYSVEKVKTVGDDAPFFGIFVYLDNLFSWILGK